MWIQQSWSLTAFDRKELCQWIHLSMPDRVAQYVHMLTCRMHIFQFCLFTDIVCKVSALKSIIYQSSLITLIVFF